MNKGPKKTRLGQELIASLKEAVKKTDLNHTLPYTTICANCAQKRLGKWPEGHVATHGAKAEGERSEMHHALCPYCKKGATVCSVDDWLWPGQKELKNWD